MESPFIRGSLIQIGILRNFPPMVIEFNQKARSWIAEREKDEAERESMKNEIEKLTLKYTSFGHFYNVSADLRPCLAFCLFWSSFFAAFP